MVELVTGMERRLAAILAADVVGYSRLMEADEAGTLAALNERRQDLLVPLVDRHRGRIVKLMGDGVLIEFASAVNAVSCAVELQRAMAEANAALPAARRIVMRVGINLGDVLVEGPDLYGDGVNIAARLEAAADPGDVLIAGTVYDQVVNKVAFAFEDLGSRTVKNIAKAIRFYRVADGGSGAPRTGEESRAETLTPPSRPSIAVLPFVNMSGDPEQEYLADGLTEDIITGLSRVHALFVIARNSTFTYKGRTVSVKQVASELGVRYVLEGSVRRSDHRIRITAQLIEAATSHHVWAEKFDRELVQIFDLQDEITRNVVASTQTQILLAEGHSAHRHNRPDLDVWSLVSRSMARMHDLTDESLADAERLADEALQIDPTSGAAWRCRSIATYHRAHMSPAGDYEAMLMRALETAERAVRLDVNDEYARWTLGNVLLALRHHERAIAELERALEINPNYSMACGSLGTALCYIGQPEAGIARNEVAIRSDPLNPGIFFRYSGLALGHYLVGSFEQAALWARKAVQRNRSWYLGHVYLIAALAQLDRMEDARSARQEYLRLFPQATISDLKRLPMRSGADLERICDGLRKAGLPE